jgi:gamma-glutamyl phosphate reductase
VEYLESLGRRAKAASTKCALLSRADKDKALGAIAQALIANSDMILSENQKDLAAAKQNGMRQSMQDRLLLTEQRIGQIVQSLYKLIELDDPIGKSTKMGGVKNGLDIRRVTVPLGVVAIIYESRPNVTVDCAALCFKTGNSVILRGGKEAINSNAALVKTMRSALENCGFDPDCILLVEDLSRECSTALMKLNKYVDVLIPRGSAGLIRSVVENATVPAIETGSGNCHIYIEKSANLKMAADIVDNAKTSRPSVCNAAESLVVDEQIADKFLPLIKDRLKNVELRGCPRAAEIINIKKATDEDFYTEYNDYIMSVKVVGDINEAIEFINEHSTSHSDAIVTEDAAAAEMFLKQIDSAAVYVNASTRFTDGFEFGLGAEIGISTQKLHARGPMGLEALTSYKYVIHGSGQIRG